MKRLIVNADDFGLTAGVNQAIIELNHQRSVTSATLMVNAAETQMAATSALATPALGVGCHIVLVDGAPVLPAAQLPTLTDPKTGRFHATLGKFVRSLFLGRIQSSEIAAEAEAQIGRLRSLGIAPTHVDTHKHTHMFPAVLRPLLAAAKSNQITAIRNPYEPEWSRLATPRAPTLRRLQVRILNRFRADFFSLVEQAHLATTDGAIGVLATGSLDEAALSSILRAMPDGVFELVTHPAYNDPALAQAGTRLLASREVELHALRCLSLDQDIQRIHFGQLTS